MKVPPLVVGIGAGIAALALLTPATGRALVELKAARGAHAQLAQFAAQPQRQVPIVDATLRLAAPDPAAGRAAIMARLQRLAKTGGVLVEESNAIEAPPRLVLLRVRISGAEKAVLAFVDAFERELPLMRFRRWSIEPVAGGVRLAGEVVAVQ